MRDKALEIFTNIVGCKILAKQLEEGIYNFTVKESTSRKVMISLDNAYFKLIYKDRARMIWLHLKTHKDEIDLLKKKKFIYRTVFRFYSSRIISRFMGSIY